jgi:hypothetical protein
VNIKWRSRVRGERERLRSGRLLDKSGKHLVVGISCDIRRYAQGCGHVVVAVAESAGEVDHELRAGD